MSKDRIDLTYFQGITENRGAMNYEVDENGMVGNILGIEMTQKDAAAIYNIPKFLAELKRCYRIIDILQDSEDFDTQVAFHEEGLCKYLKYPCGPCESLEE